jgi:endonuclease YncB( thermonuclease family)
LKLNRKADLMQKLKLLVVFFLLSITVFTQTITGNVSYVSDGDTLHLVSNGEKYKIRFYGVDSPESSQDYGLESKEFVMKRVSGKTVKVQVMDTDRYGRKVGKIYYGSGKYLNEEVVRAGYAWHYRQYAPNDSDIKQAEATARSSKIGLWKSSNPTPPWEYRSAKRSPEQPQAGNSVASSKNNIENVVYITKSGKKYHRQNCPTIKHLAGSLPRSEAAAKGYEACKVCKP